MRPWRIYYSDGATFSSEDGTPDDAPGVGVLVIAQLDMFGDRELLHGDGPRVVDWFWWEDGSWLCGDMAGVVQYLAAPGAKKLLAGRNVANHLFHEAMKQAAHDPLP